MRKPRAGRAVAGARGREDGSAGGWGTLAGGTRGWRGPLGTRGRVPGRPLGGKAWVWRGGLSLRAPPHCHTELPWAPQGGRSPRAFLSARPWTGGQRVWPGLSRWAPRDPAGQDTRAVRWHLALSPRSRGQGSPAVAQRPGKRRQCQQPRGVSAALAGQCPLRCRPSHPERGEQGAPPACAVPPQPASATQPRGAGGPGVQSVWVPA